MDGNAGMINIESIENTLFSLVKPTATSAIDLDV